MQGQRQSKRIIVDIPVTIISILESAEASIADLSEEGALIQGVGLPTGMRVQIEYRGQTVFAQCRWSEVDRMGVKFLFRLTDGPLYERLQMAKTSQSVEAGSIAMQAVMPPLHHGLTTLGARTFGRAAPSGSFGRRG